MDLYRKFLILFIIIIASYILYNLLKTRSALINKTFDIQKEGFGFGMSTAESEVKSITISSGAGVSNFDTKKSNLAISEYVIKSSYNSAFTGSYVSLDAIKYVLSRGCRFLDFELFLIDGGVYVAQSNDPQNMSINSQNHLPLDDVLACVSIYGFTAPSPNPMDPLFIQLRIKTDTPEIYKDTALSIDKNLINKLYGTPEKRKLIPSTLIGDLMGKVVLIIDKIVSPNYNSFPICTTTDTTCYNLDNYANMIAGSESLRTYKINNLLEQHTRPYNVDDNNITTDTIKMQIAIPDIDTVNLNNPDIIPLIKNYGVQITGYRFYKNDSNLTNYELLFSGNNSAFVSLAAVFHIITNQSADRPLELLNP